MRRSGFLKSLLAVPLAAIGLMAAEGDNPILRVCLGRVGVAPVARCLVEFDVLEYKSGAVWIDVCGSVERVVDRNGHYRYKTRAGSKHDRIDLVGTRDCDAVVENVSVRRIQDREMWKRLHFAENYSLNHAKRV